MRKKKPTMRTACEAIAQSLREYGYHDATARMVWECWCEITERNTPDEGMPHGIIGRFAFSQLAKNREWLEKLPQEAP